MVVTILDYPLLAQLFPPDRPLVSRLMRENL